MKRIRVMNVSIEFNANQLTVGDNVTQARAAMKQLNLLLQKQLFGLNAQFVSIDETGEDDIELVPGMEHATGHLKRKMRTVEMAVSFTDGTWKPSYHAQIPIDTPEDEIEEAGRKFILNEYTDDDHDHEIAHVWLYNSMDDEGIDDES